MIQQIKNKPIGYKAICEMLNLSTIPHYRESYVAMHGRGKSIIDNRYETHIYPKTYALKDDKDLLSNLEFALKHEGINLEIIKGLFFHLDAKTVAERVKQQPTGIYARKIWYLYEFLMQKKLDIPDSKKLKYINLLDEKQYYTSKGNKSSRQGINDNMLGNHQFCPFVRRTKKIEEYIQLKLDDEAKKIISQYDTVTIARASNYLYTKETMSSFEIEKERPDKTRAARFISILQKASTIKQISKKVLIELQNSIVDPRFLDVDYRKSQNYVGENITIYLPKIHYISPKPENVEELMQGLLDSLDEMEKSNLNPVIIASIISFGFVFIHPFEDGNGRIHRFLIHSTLSKNGFTPEDIIFPVSAIMLKNMYDYDSILESFSKPLLEILTNYTLSDEGVMSVNQDSKMYYQYLDYTYITEYLFQCIHEAIHKELETEIRFLLSYDKTKREIQNIVDLPDRKIDLIIKLVRQNRGHLSRKIQQDHFSQLSAEEIAKIVACINDNMTPIK